MLNKVALKPMVCAFNLKVLIIIHRSFGFLFQARKCQYLHGQYVIFYYTGINECEPNNGTGSCSDKCTDLLTGYSCTCTEGRQLLNDGLNCQGNSLSEGNRD